MARIAQSSKTYTDASLSRMLRSMGYRDTVAAELVAEAHEGIPTVFVDCNDTVFDMVPQGAGSILVRQHKS